MRGPWGVEGRGEGRRGEQGESQEQSSRDQEVGWVMDYWNNDSENVL